MTARTYAALVARRRVAEDAYLAATYHHLQIPRDRGHRDERMEWGLIRSACARELQALKGQITRAARAEGLRQ